MFFILKYLLAAHETVASVQVVNNLLTYEMHFNGKQAYTVLGLLNYLQTSVTR
jgi:hypothetical protein